MEFQEVAPDLRLGCDTDEHGRLVFEYDGHLEAYNSRMAESYISAILDLRPGTQTNTETTIVLDIQKLEFLDSYGVKTFLNLSDFANENGYNLILRYPTKTVSHILEITQLDEYFEVERNDNET